MADAYKCDFCGEYRDGKPKKTLYEESHDRAQNVEYRPWAEICSDCLADAKEDDDAE